MFRATRDFIEYRQPFALPYKVELVTVKRIGGGVQHECYNNSGNYVDKSKAQGEDVGMWSGWIVLPYDKKTNTTLIAQHWWNIKRSGEQIDTTPLTGEVEYVQDFALQKFCGKNGLKLKTHIAHSLIYQDGVFRIILDPYTNRFAPLLEPHTESLYVEKWAWSISTN